jgi:hypothetical protein
MSVTPLDFPKEIADFIYRRSTRFIERHKSLETMVAGAYIQGMNDAIDALEYLKDQP